MTQMMKLVLDDKFATVLQALNDGLGWSCNTRMSCFCNSMPMPDYHLEITRCRRGADGYATDKRQTIIQLRSFPRVGGPKHDYWHIEDLDEIAFESILPPHLRPTFHSDYSDEQLIAFLQACAYNKGGPIVVKNSDKGPLDPDAPCIVPLG